LFSLFQRSFPVNLTRCVQASMLAALWTMLCECTPQEKIADIAELPVGDVSGRCRVWIRHTLNDRTLASAFDRIAGDKRLLDAYYGSAATLRDPGRVAAIRTALAPLQQFSFSLSIGDLCARPEEQPEASASAATTPAASTVASEATPLASLSPASAATNAAQGAASFMTSLLPGPADTMSLHSHVDEASGDAASLHSLPASMTSANSTAAGGPDTSVSSRLSSLFSSRTHTTSEHDTPAATAASAVIAV
jgi:hypothetical protein